MILYFIRIFVATVVFFVGSTFALVLMLLGFGKNDRAFYYARFLMPQITKILGIQVEVRNRQRLQESAPCVFAVNHQHTFDLFVHGWVIPTNTITIGKKSIRYIPIFGWIFVMVGCILIDRAKHSSAMESMSMAAREMNARKKSIWIFVEGTRSGKRGLLPFKKGAFHLAISGKRPVVPIVTSSYFHSIDIRKWNAGTVVIEVMEPIPTSQLQLSDIEFLTLKTHDLMKHKLESLNQEILAAKKSRLS